MAIRCPIGRAKAGRAMAASEADRGPGRSRPLGRRRAITLIAAAGGATLGGAGLAGLLSGQAASAPSRRSHRWRGTALGARAELLIHHEDAREAARLIDLALAEIERLERLFSLYRRDSALVRLNRTGALEAPPLELVALLDRARVWHRLSAGAFDVTVQPLWRLYRDHFAAGPADGPADGPAETRVEAALRLVGQAELSATAGRVALHQPGMAVTLNGIAQGYITDRVAELWRAEGLDQVLIDLGELRALGDHPDGRPWRVGLKTSADASPAETTVEISGAALATSSTFGDSFDEAGRFHHLLDPRTGRPTVGPRSVSVVARTATDADALSTALLVSLPKMPARDQLARMGIQRIVATDPVGRVRALL